MRALQILKVKDVLVTRCLRFCRQIWISVLIKWNFSFLLVVAHLPVFEHWPRLHERFLFFSGFSDL